MPAPQTWDIFCAVIDNYGDIGVTWRLARQLAAEFGLRVRLWLDDLGALRHLWPRVADLDEQLIDGVQVRRWTDPFPEVAPADVVIEAFACELPQAYIAAMSRRARAPVWINLEYLSAETWVDDCHGLPSPQPGGLRKYFFFPGFTGRTGGLLQERGLAGRRRRFQADAGRAGAFLDRLIAAPLPQAERTVSLFAYENPAIEPLLRRWAGAPTTTLCLVPEGRALAQVAGVFGERALAAGTVHRRGALSVAAFPFLAQDDYDRLLWCCDMNFVRGEDSFLRAQWAARPLVWQIYPQSEGAHWPKLDAFIALYSAGLSQSATAALSDFWHAWNGRGDIGAAWSRWEQALPELEKYAMRWADEWAARENLAQRLVQFCANQV